MPRKLISTRIDEDLYEQLKVLSYELSSKSKVKINVNDLIEEAISRFLKEQ